MISTNKDYECHIKLHSITDLITNSSTTIYTYSENSIDALKELVDEFFKSFNIDKKCDDIFQISLEKNDESFLDDCIDWLDSASDDNVLYKIPKKFLNEETCEEELANLIKSIKSGAVQKPKWFKIMEEEIEENRSLPAETFIKIQVKDKKYEKLAKLIFDFLYSTNHEAIEG